MSRTMEQIVVSVAIVIGICIGTGFSHSEDGEYLAPLYSGTSQPYGKYIVKLTDDVDVDPSIVEIDDILKAKSATYNISRVFKHAIKAFAADLHVEDLDTIRRSTMVEFVEDDVTVMHFNTPLNAGRVPWGLDRIDQRSVQLDNQYDVNGDGSNVNVYVIDTGILTSHEEFDDRANVAFDTVDGKGEDCAGHGTHCAGIIGGNNYGVAKGVKLFGIRTMDCSGLGSSSDVIEALEWIGKHAQFPAVASISLGTTDDKPSRALDRAVEMVIDKGVVVVAAAGNSGTDACKVSPARVEKVITVGAIGVGDLLATFSNVGKCIDILAPGVNIESTWYDGVDAIKVLSGTSMACPHVSGAAALVLGNQPDLSPAEVKRLLLENATHDVVHNVNGACPNILLYVP